MLGCDCPPEPVDPRPKSVRKREAWQREHQKLKNVYIAARKFCKICAEEFISYERGANITRVVAALATLRHAVEQVEKERRNTLPGEMEP